MYFPYVRGRQYELLALRELMKNSLLSNKIIPIIEPVKLSSTLIKTMDEFIKKGKEIAFIVNPTVGDFSKDMKDADKDPYKQQLNQLLQDNNIVKAHIMKANSSANLDRWEKRGVAKNELIVINTNREHLELYGELFSEQGPRHVLIPGESAFRRKVRNQCILFDDKFEKQERNADYQEQSDEFFSEDHIYFKDEGFEGFADFSVVGKGYKESGFAPYAIAIHIVYFTKDGTLRIKHFVSDSNDDISNPAMKFYEALEKLYVWQQETHIQMTLGLKTLLKHYSEQTYPGLGSVKKLSIMHHIELVSKYMDGEIE